MLTAATEVARLSGVRHVTLTAIADGTGLHKSAVLRYFANREALLLDLCRQEWQGWAAALAETAASHPPGGRRGAAGIVSVSLERRPMFCDLLAQTPVVLEREAPVGVVRDFKLDVLAAVDVAAGAVQSLTGDLTRRQAVHLVGVATSLAGTLWHVAHPPPALRAAYEADPRLAAACIEFEPELAELLGTYIDGLRSRSQEGEASGSGSTPSLQGE